jgi:uncharacterized membrane protein YecN with MAPEG domain
MTIIAGYAAILGFVFVALSLRVIRLRRSGQIALGSGGQPLLRKAIRAHANFAEYVPMALLLIALAESQGVWPSVIHGLALSLLAGRLLHAYGVSQLQENFRYRVSGMVLTFTAIGSASLLLLLKS